MAGLTTPSVMGILNVTPDSFSDGGRFAVIDAALAAGRAMSQAGAAMIDVGGESTRPGAAVIPPDEEQRRILPVVAGLVAEGIAVSVDTRNAATMRAMLRAGATMINDVSGLTHDPQAAAVVAEHACHIVLMHMRGTPQTMAGLTDYDDVLAEVCAGLTARRDAALAAGIKPANIVLDPGIGFAKTPAQSVALLRGLPAICVLGLPVLVGVSRKVVIGVLSGEPDPARRDAGSIVAGVFAAEQGAALLRVHDVAGHVQALRVWAGVRGGVKTFFSGNGQVSAC